jgi:hypothetical protein
LVNDSNPPVYKGISPERRETGDWREKRDEDERIETRYTNYTV